MKDEINNSLEYLIKNGYLTNPHDLALYVISKSWLGVEIPDKQAIIDYFNSQQDDDGGWERGGTHFTRMFTTHRVLLAYNILGVTPAKNMNVFFSGYDTIQKVKNYIIYETKSDARDVYHILFGWVLYYYTYPLWLNDFFTTVEQDLSWTTSDDFHMRTHILYSYVIARRKFPNLNGIIEKTLMQQANDGSWKYHRPVYGTAIQLGLLSQILTLYYPFQSSWQIKQAIYKAKPWVLSQYRTEIINGDILGYFGDIPAIEDALLTGIICAGLTGIIDTNIDLTFQKILDRINPLPVPLWKIALLFTTLFGGAFYVIKSSGGN